MNEPTADLYDLIMKYKLMRQTYLDCYQCISMIRDKIKANKYTMPDLVNVVYVLRDISKFSDDLRKECNGVEQIAINVACALWVTFDSSINIKASLATGTPDIKIAAAIPNKNREPEKFNALMDALGVDPKAVADNTVKPYWPGIMEYISSLAEQGKPLPVGIDAEKTYTQYKMRITPYKGLDELLTVLENISGKDEEMENVLTKRK